MLPTTPNGAPAPATTQTEPELKDRTSTPRGVLQKNLKTMVYVGGARPCSCYVRQQRQEKGDHDRADQGCSPEPTSPGQHREQCPGAPFSTRNRAPAAAAGGESRGSLRNPGATGIGSLLRCDGSACSLCPRPGLQYPGCLRSRRRPTQQRKRQRSGAALARTTADAATRGKGTGAAVCLSLRIQPCL